MNGFMKGVCVGMMTGVALTMTVAPLDKKRIMRSPVGKTFKTCKSVINDIHDAF
ncbi:MAG: hypothetical protein FWH06_07585 [Oscillospiraceae bacterium]|nr:hypothetical protein [Oscillospiraceae bacterium]